MPSLPPVAGELAQRLANYGIDDEARVRLQAMWAALEPLIAAVIDETIAGGRKLPHVEALWSAHGQEFKRIESEHFRALFAADFDAGYICPGSIFPKASPRPPRT